MSVSRRIAMMSFAALPVIFIAPTSVFSRDGARRKSDCEMLEEEMRSLRRQLRKAKSDSAKREIRLDIEDVEDDMDDKDC